MSRRRRKHDVEAEQRRRDFDDAVALARAEPSPPNPQPVPPDVAQLVDQALARREAAAAEARQRADYERARCPSGRGCRRCGLEAVAVADPDGSTSPGWHVEDGGHVCEICRREHDELPFTAGPGEEKEVVARRLLGRTSIPMRAVGDPGAFESLRLWHYEHPGAPPVQTVEERFAHVDLAALGDAYERIANPVVETVREFARREKCPHCGVRDRWVEVDVSTPQLDGSPSVVTKGWRCMACIVSQPWGDAGRAAMA